MRRRVGKGVEEHSEVNILIARCIANLIVKVQRKIAVCLQYWESRYTIKQKKIGLLLFALAGTVYFLMVLGKALVVNEAEKSIMGIEHNKPPFIPPAIKLLDTVKH